MIAMGRQTSKGNSLVPRFNRHKVKERGGKQTVNPRLSLTSCLFNRILISFILNTRPLLELRTVSKSYGDQTALAPLSLSLQAGEIFGLLGASGAGKSTLLQLAANLINPDAGEVWLEGVKLELPSDLLIPGHPEIKIVHQDYHLSPTLSVRENIRYALRYYEKAYRDTRIEELLALCQLESLAEQPTKLLSGGEKQRTAIARALAEEARVLLLDEPFAHLDLPNNRRLAETIRSIVAETQAACIFVTHHAADALSLAQHLGVLQQGHLIHMGTPEEIYQHPANAYVAGLCGEANVLDRAWVAQYFAHQPWHEMPENKVLIRPEALALFKRPAAGRVEVRVERCIFEGSRYRVNVRLADEMLVAYHSIALAEGRKIYLAPKNRPA